MVVEEPPKSDELSLIWITIVPEVKSLGGLEVTTTEAGVMFPSVHLEMNAGAWAFTSLIHVESSELVKP